MKLFLSIVLIASLECVAIAESLTWVQGSKQTVTLPSGQDYDHALVYALGKVWMALNNSPAKMVRFNNPMDLTDRTVLNFPNDGYHNLTRDLIYVPTKGKFYMTFLSGTYILISEIDPVTLAYTDVVRTNTANLSHSICATDTHLFLTCTSTTNTAVLLKFSMSNWAQTGRIDFAPRTALQSPRYDGTNVYLMAGDNSPGWVAKVDPTTLTYSVADLLTQENAVGDNQSFFGDYFWVPLFNSDSDTNILKVAKSNLSITRINTGLPYPDYTVFTDSQYVWRALGSAPGTIQRIDPNTLSMYSMTLETGEDIPSDIVSDGTHLFIGLDTSPAKLIRLIPVLLGDTPPQPKNLSVSVAGKSAVTGSIVMQ